MKNVRHIVLVEDDARDAELTLEALKSFNLANNLVHLKDGAEALDYVHRRGVFADRPPEPPGLLLLDLKMPKVGGVEVLREMKGDPELKTIPIVVMTSSRENHDLFECYRLGVNAYVVKPVKFVEFVDAVKQIGLFWAVVNEPCPPRANGGSAR